MDMNEEADEMILFAKRLELHCLPLPRSVAYTSGYVLSSLVTVVRIIREEYFENFSSESSQRPPSYFSPRSAESSCSVS